MEEFAYLLGILPAALETNAAPCFDDVALAVMRAIEQVASSRPGYPAKVPM
jgi:hypothetical protein